MSKAALAASSTVLLTLAAATTGLGSSSAEAFEITAQSYQAGMTLTGDETTLVATDYRVAERMCWEAAQQALGSPLNLLDCAKQVNACASLAAGKPATVIFYWTSTECRY